MAIIDFQILGQNDGGLNLETLSGSGLGFFGSTAGASVQIGSYQDTTYVSNGDGSETKDQTNNVKFVGDTFPSGMCTANAIGGTYGPIGLSGVKSYESTLGIRFGHNTAVKTQNVQLRVYDRSNINYPASGVNTKVAEIVNFGAGGAYDSQGSAGVGSDAVGSGDAFWWGEPWPSELVSKNYWTNSLGTKFYNGLNGASVNGDIRLGNVTDDDETVGGSGLIVPLLDSPGSGQRGLDEVAGSTGMIWPKWTQYIHTTSNQQLWAGSTDHNFGDGSSNLTLNQGGTGYHTHHTWSVALSASPLNIGSKEQYGLYVSLEYL